MNTEFRAMCAELLVLAEESISYRAQVSEAVNLIDRARALLAQPVAEGPTDDELWAAGSDDFCANYYPTDAIAYARAVLAKWGNK